MVLTLSARTRDLPKFATVCFSLPRVLGAGGIATTLQPWLDAQEHAALERSAGILREVAAAHGL